MTNDLISREALKAYARKVLYGDHPTNTLLIRMFDEIIDNAPSDADRPQGMWIDHSEDGYVECPFCEHLTNCEDNIDELHYCWNCGAKMWRGGAE